MPRYFFSCTGGAVYDVNDNRKSQENGYEQGGRSSDQSGNKKSIILFNSSSIRNNLFLQSVSAVYFDYYVSDGGQSTMFIGTHNYTSVPNQWSDSRTKPDRARRRNSGHGFTTGPNMGSTVGAEFKNGLATGIVIGPASFSAADNYCAIRDNGTSDEPVLVIDAAILDTAPGRPTLQEPASGAVLDVTADGAAFRWQHNDSQGQDQAAWYFRRTHPDGTVDYWNGAGWQSSEFRLTSANSDYSNGVMRIPAGVWARELLYADWTVKTEDTSGLVGNYAEDRRLYNSRRPVTTVTEPDGTTNVARPTIRWGYSDPDAETQYTWEAQIVPPDTYNDLSWSPTDVSGYTWYATADTDATAVTVGTDLENHTIYRAYVRTGSSPNPAGGIQYSTWDFTEFEVVVPPFPPSITYPQNGSSVDLAAGFTLEWQNNFYGPGTQSSFAIRRLAEGGTYEWWDGGAWSATETFLAGNRSSYAFRTNEVPNDVTYTFSVAIQDAYGEQSAYSNGSTVTGSTAAQVTVTAPRGTIAEINPLVMWSVFDQNGLPQQTFHVRVFHSSEYADGVIDPVNDTAVWDSGETVSSSVRSVRIPVDLQNANEYRAYVRVQTGNVYSGWSYGEFLVLQVAPASPAAVATVVEDAGAIDVIIQGRESILDDIASRSAIGGWEPFENCTVEGSVFFESSQSQLITNLTSTATGVMSAQTVEDYQIAPNVVYTAAATLVPAVDTAGVECYVSIQFLNSVGNTVSIVSADEMVDDAAVRVSVSSLPPNGAVTARMRVTFRVNEVGVTHGLFDPVLRPGLGDEWSPGGLLGSTYVSVRELNDDRALRRGLDIPVPVLSQQVTIRDEEPPSGRQQRYELVMRAVYPSAVLASVPTVLEQIVWTSGWLWLSDPLRPGSGRSFGPQSFSSTTRPVRQGKFRPIGRPDAVIISGVRGLREGSFTIVTPDRATRDAYLEIANESDVVLLRIPPDQGDPEGETIYVKLEGDAPETRPFNSRTPHRTITQAWTEQFRPIENLRYSDDT